MLPAVGFLSLITPASAPQPHATHGLAHGSSWRPPRARRTLAGGLLAAMAVLLLGFAIERLRLGADDTDLLARVAADARGTVDSLAGELRAVASRANVAAADVTAAPTDADAARALFDAARHALGAAARGDAAFTVYGAAGVPLAWSGRPSELPAQRVLGAEALFVTPGPIGPRLVHLAPVIEVPSGRRVGSVAAERVIASVGHDQQGVAPTPAVLPTSLVPVTLRPRYEGAGERPPAHGFLVSDAAGAPLLEGTVAPGALEDLRASYRGRTLGAAFLAFALALLVLAVPLLERRDAAGSAPAHVRTLLQLVGIIVLVRLLLTAALGWDAPGTAGEGPGGLDGWLLRSPAEFLATAIAWLAVVAVVAPSVERRRLAARRERPPQWPAFAAAQLLAGVLLVGVLAWHHRWIEALFVLSDHDPLEFSLHPFEAERLALVFGAVVLHAAALWTAVLTLRLAGTWWRIRRSNRVRRAGIAVAWMTPLAVVLLADVRTGADLPATLLLLPAVVAVLAAGAARYAAPRFRRASQAARLVALFLALAAPAIVSQPTMVALADQQAESVIAGPLAQEALGHRDQLRRQLQQSLAQIDELPGLWELVQLPPPRDGEPAPSDPAYLVWSQTDLARLRLTSSVELYAPDGALVSRFALNLPVEAAATAEWQEPACDWDIFGEPLAGTEDRVLLHAGRGICPPNGGPAARPEGAIVVHVLLDYGTLPFLASRNPYGDLLQSRGEVSHHAHGRRIEFAMYGWGRTPVFPTEGTPWPISSELLARIYQSGREPLWETVEHGDQRYRVLFLNDRSGIYALGYLLPTPVEHLISIAELLTLAGVAYVLLLAGVSLLASAGGYRANTARALLREVRGSFYRKLFLAFVAAAVVPVLALAVLTRTFIATQMRDSIELAASRTASVAKRVVDSVASQQRRGTGAPPTLTDDIMVSVSRVINEDVNVYVGPRLVATSQRDLFASGRLPIRTPAEVYRAIVLERQAGYVGEQAIGTFPFVIAAAPVREGEVRTILTVPLALRQQEIEREVDALDRRVLLATLCFILLGAAIGYYMAERIADPVNRLTRATRRIARGDLDARIVTSSSDELRRLVDAFNSMAADLQRQRTELERTNRLAAWADMARQVAHDIKNPLTPIQLSAEHLRRVHRDRGEPLSPVLDACVETILSQVRLLRQISAEFSSFASSPVARLTPTAVNEVVDEVVQPYLTQPAGRVHIELSLASDLPLVPIDRLLLGRALVNIVENALHAMPGGGTLTVATRSGDGEIAVEVRDTGIGMDAEAMARLFEPYFSTRAAGTGLGLTIAKRNVELNGGQIAVQSAAGQGTAVTLRFPTV
jgi:signal transduction histidine kinase